MSDEININNLPTELSEEELDDVSGGFDIFISGSTFEQTHISSFNRGQSSINGFSGGISSFRSSHTSSSAFQIAGLGFNSVSDALGFLGGFAKLFGRR
ncbi:MAG: CTB family bacteriocin [Cyanobacteria bacterium P01_A01_bin.84]